MELNVNDSFLHTKTDVGSDGVIMNEEKITLPITRWENIMGRPEIVTLETADQVHGISYLYLRRRQMVLSDQLFANLYPEFLQ